MPTLKSKIGNILFIVAVLLVVNACKNKSKLALEQSGDTITYPSDVIPFMDKWKILLGDGTRTENLVDYKKDDFFMLIMMGLQIGWYTIHQIQV